MSRADSQIDYLTIGHVCLDITTAGYVPGGGVTFAARVAAAMGCRTVVLTSSATDYHHEEVLGQVEVKSIPSEHTTTFENIYEENERKQTIHVVSENLEPSHLPPRWKNPAIVHIAPIANEVDPEIIHLFDNSLIGLGPQGWLRRWDEKGHIEACDWPGADLFFPLADVVILSEEDLPDHASLDRYRRFAQLLVLTQGAAGCTLFYDDGSRHISAPKVKEIEPTGAGDIFSAAFLIRFYRNGHDPLDAATFANQIAARSVTQPDFESKVVGLNV